MLRPARPAYAQRERQRRADPNAGLNALPYHAEGLVPLNHLGISIGSTDGELERYHPADALAF